jgi:hypothetical protein
MLNDNLNSNDIQVLNKIINGNNLNTEVNNVSLIEMRDRNLEGNQNENNGRVVRENSNNLSQNNISHMNVNLNNKNNGDHSINIHNNENLNLNNESVIKSKKEILM